MSIKEIKSKLGRVCLFRNAKCLFQYAYFGIYIKQDFEMQNSSDASRNVIPALTADTAALSDVAV